MSLTIGFSPKDLDKDGNLKEGFKIIRKLEPTEEVKAVSEEDTASASETVEEKEKEPTEEAKTKSVKKK